MNGYDIAQICLNGHVANVATRTFPEDNRKFCDRCGEPTTNECQSCHANIRGPHVSLEGSMLRANSHTTDDWTVPSFCESCGQPYPWTQSKIEAAKEILELQTALTAQEKADFNADMNDIVRDVPRTRAAALRIKSLITKLPGAAGSVLRDLFVEVASETAKKIITGS